MDCIICHENLLKTGYGVSIECGHIFHGKCLIEWGNSQIAQAPEIFCPVCRKNFTTEMIHPIYLSGSEIDEAFKYNLNRESNSKNTIYIIPIEIAPQEPQRIIIERKRQFISCRSQIIIIIISTIVIIGSTIYWNYYY